MIENRFKKDNNNQGVRCHNLGAFKRQAKPYILENPKEFLRGMAKDEKEVLLGLDESFDEDQLDFNIIGGRDDEISYMILNFLKVSKFLKIQLTKTFERKENFN